MIKIADIVRDERQLMNERSTCNKQVDLWCGSPLVKKDGANFTEFAGNRMVDRNKHHLRQKIG